MTFDDENTDILECILELFPDDLELVPHIITSYHFDSNILPNSSTILTQDLEDELKKVHFEIFACDLVYDRKEPEPLAGWHFHDLSLLHHRGAQRQINEHPELFVKQKDNPMMKYISYG